MNNFRFLTPTVHGALDYAAAAGLIVLPFLLGFSGLAQWLSVAGGLGLIGYSLLTDYALSVATVLSFKTHLVLDLTAGAVFIVAPFAFGWTGLVMGYYFVMAAGVIAVVALTNSSAEMAAGVSASAGA